MKLAVISFSGNVGKTTIARHLLLPRIPGARLIAVESINAEEEQDHLIRGRQFAELQEFLQLAHRAIVDIGASNVEEVVSSTRRYRGSHEDFDAFIVPTVPTLKQQHDTIATLAELSRLGVDPDRVRIVFNMVEEDSDFARTFDPVIRFVTETHVARASLDCRLGINEVYALAKATGSDLRTLAADATDFKALIAREPDTTAQVALAHRLAMHRLAAGVVPELDACFQALHLSSPTERGSAASRACTE